MDNNNSSIKQLLKLHNDTQLFCDDSNAYIYRPHHKSLKISLKKSNKKDIEILFSKLKSGIIYNELFKFKKYQNNGINLQSIIHLLKKTNFFIHTDELNSIKQEDKERYERQLNWFGINLPKYSPYEIQRKIFDKKICLFGLGSLGNLLLMELAAMGFRNFTIIDKDNVEISNLNRQILYTEKDINKPKVDSAKRWLKSFDKNIKVKAIKKNLDSHHILNETLGNYDILILTADEPKSDIVFWTSKYCASKKIPWLRFSRMGIGPLYKKDQDPCPACLLQTMVDDKKLAKFFEKTNLSLNRSKSVLMSEVSFAISIATHEIFLYLTMGSDKLKGGVIKIEVKNNDLKVKLVSVKKSENCSCNIYG